jgi:hypothetical protein
MRVITTRTNSGTLDVVRLDIMDKDAYSVRRQNRDRIAGLPPLLCAGAVRDHRFRETKVTNIPSRNPPTCAHHATPPDAIAPRLLIPWRN